MKRIILLIISLSIVLFSCGTAYKEFNPSRMLQKYEWFKDTHTKMESTMRMIKSSDATMKDMKSTYGDPKNWGWETKDEYNRLRSVRQGYISLYNSLVAEYNSQSSKFNWSSFKTDIPRTYEEYVE